LIGTEAKNMMKNTKKSKKGVVKVEAAPAEAVKPIVVKAAAAPPSRVVFDVANSAGKKVEAEPVEAVKPVTVKATTAPPPRVVLELVNPAAKRVFVAGSFNNWQPEQTPLAPAGNGRWAGDLKVRPGRHEYLFVVDGQWLPDPNAKESVQNPFGGRNSVLTVSE
jgi:hypothetical protein